LKRPIVSWKKVEKVLKKLGYEYQRQNGSHIIYKHPNPLPPPESVIRVLGPNKYRWGEISLPKHRELDSGTRDGIINQISEHTGIPEEAIVEMLR
jgi:hypothetical protein